MNQQPSVPKKIRITVTAVVEYTPNPENYPDPSPEAMLATDLDNANDDTFGFLDGVDNWKITGELVG